MDGAQLGRADFLDALGLTADQVSSAVTDARTRWPTYLRDQAVFTSEDGTQAAADRS